MSFCRQCGSVVSDQAGQCGQCGAPIQSVSGQSVPGQSMPNQSGAATAATPASTTAPFDYYIRAFHLYAEFRGRASRPAFWYFVLFDVLFGIGFSIIDEIFHPDFFGHVDAELNSLYNLLTLLPSIAVLVRRLHDTDRSGWLALLMLIPVLGWIPLIIFLCQPSDTAVNQHGVSSD